MPPLLQSDVLNQSQESVHIKSRVSRLTADDTTDTFLAMVCSCFPGHGAPLLTLRSLDAPWPWTRTMTALTPHDSIITHWPRIEDYI